MREKIAFVCQRYGLEINGGAELECRQYAERLTSKYDVEVYTSCAIDYVTWANEYSEGTENINGVTVHRFKAEKERNPKEFEAISNRVMGGAPHSDAEEDRWIDDQGPLCRKLLQVLSERHT